MNKDFQQSLNELKKARLEVLLQSINELYDSNGMILEQDLITLYHTAINTFYSSLNNSITGSTVPILTGTPPDPDIYNQLTQAISQDLLAIYNEINIIDKMISANFNSVSIRVQEVLESNKRIANKLGDYLLYSDPNLGAGFFFSDNFNSANKLDVSSNLIEETIAYHDSVEGSVLLPLNGEPTFPEIKEIIINETSNGETGNNHQLNIFGHNSIEAIGDNKPNTWFEYERVTSRELLTPLVLDLTFVLSESSIINYININPLFFGTPTPLEILNIETSKDGKTFLSIKDDLPIKDFLPEDEANVFKLSAATDNYSGQGSYSFLPRKAKYIHIVLEQNTPYTIETINGNKLRYAIGIRDINITSRKFQTSGSIVSSPFTTDKEIKKLSLWAAENPIQQSTLADISHYVSYNDGGSWYQIQPQARLDSDIPEVLNFNIGTDDSIISENKVTSLRHKITFNRNAEAFNGEYAVKEEELEQLDIIDIPSPVDPKITLSNEPIKESTTIILPYMGSFSCPRDRYGINVLDESSLMNLDFVQFNIDVPGSISAESPSGSTQQEGTIRYTLPYKNIPYLSEKIRVFVNGAQVEYRPKDDYFFDNPSEFTPNPVSITDSSKIYYLNKNGTELQFGYKQKTGSGAGYQRGFVPPSGSKIQVCLDGDNPQLQLTDVGFILNLLTPSDGDKETISIVALKTLEEDSASQYQIEIPTGERIFQAPILKDKTIGEYIESNKDGFNVPVFLTGTDNFTIKEYTLEGELITGSDKQFTEKEEFINGRYELQSFFGDELEDRYSFDSETGTVYLGTEAPTDRKVILTCKIIDAEIIDSKHWSFAKNSSTGKISPQQLILDPSVVYTIPQVTSYNIDTESERSIQLIQGNTHSHNWFNKMIVKGTVQPSSALFENNVSPIEIDFIDGISEFSNIINIKNEPISFTYLSSLSATVNLYSYTLLEADSVKQFIGPPSFSIARSTNSVLSHTNRFDIEEQVSNAASITSSGEWSCEVNSTTGVVTITIAAPTAILNEGYNISYNLEDTENNNDIKGLYSIDYYNGVIHFANIIQNSGFVSYEVSMYSCFYNIGKIIDNKNIKEINIENKQVEFTSSFALKFLKQNTVDNNRPQILKVLYNYYKRVSESLADLEPYFSPICKYVAFRAVTADLLEEL